MRFSLDGKGVPTETKSPKNLLTPSGFLVRSAYKKFIPPPFPLPATHPVEHGRPRSDNTAPKLHPYTFFVVLACGVQACTVRSLSWLRAVRRAHGRCSYVRIGKALQARIASKVMTNSHQKTLQDPVFRTLHSGNRLVAHAKRNPVCVASSAWSLPASLRNRRNLRQQP